MMVKRQNTVKTHMHDPAAKTQAVKACRTML